MGGVQQFEDLVAWQKARVLAKRVYQVSLKGPMAQDFGFRNQLRSAAVSIMNNIAEGFGRRGDKEFAQFLRMAKASTAEVQSMLYIGFDAEYLDKATFDELGKLSRETASIISGLLEYLRGKTKTSKLDSNGEGHLASSDFRHPTSD